MSRMTSIEAAFRIGTSCRIWCKCGKTYWDNHNGGWDWEDGEVEALEADENAVACDFAPGRLIIEGTEYCDACNCWHPIAERIANWLDLNKQCIATYYAREKERLTALANEVPTILEAP